MGSIKLRNIQAFSNFNYRLIKRTIKGKETKEDTHYQILASQSVCTHDCIRTFTRVYSQYKHTQRQTDRETDGDIETEKENVSFKSLITWTLF